MKYRKLILQFVFIFCYINPVFAQIKLTEFSDFKAPKGDWFQASKVGLDSIGNKQFLYEEGKGCFINGLTGRTEHLVSKESFGDVELHLEFLLPKGSNSGIY